MSVIRLETAWVGTFDRVVPHRGYSSRSFIQIRSGNSTMNVPTDRLLIMLIVATGFAVLVTGWAGGLVTAETGGWEEIGLVVGLGIVFLAVLLGIWRVFSGIDEDSS